MMKERNGRKVLFDLRDLGSVMAGDLPNASANPVPLPADQRREAPQQYIGRRASERMHRAEQRKQARAALPPSERSYSSQHLASAIIRGEILSLPKDAIRCIDLLFSMSRGEPQPNMPQRYTEDQIKRIVELLGEVKEIAVAAGRKGLAEYAERHGLAE